ncbi:melanoma-associated antigen C1-like [Ostrinia furnacalis]|uniref:melanoma-associated antigen C1-like n=1 Tax=Ostrinia furnacalis TaxID=93504 RepID=UPI001039079C|nr:melanoma-associated antigen C1-like [Ostrinia furnacalis]
MAAEHTDQKFNGSENNSSTAPYLREMIELKDRYYDKLLESYNSQTGPVVKPWTKDKVFEVIEHIKAAKVAMESDHRRNPIRYWHLRYDVIKIAEKDVLIMKKTSPDCPVVQVMPMEDYYDVLLDIHTEFGHCNSAKFQDIIRTKNLIITKKAVDVFVSLCPICDSQLSGNYNISGCIGIIDMQSVPDGQFKWIIYYQDQATKFIHVRPLCSKEGSEVAFELLKIFLDFGMPYILQSDNELDPTKVVEELIKLWPECKKINGVPLPLQTQRSEDSISQEIENLIWAWMRDNITSEWVTGCFFVQYNKNTLFDSKLKRTPFQATFRSEQNCSGISLISQGTNTSIMVTENTGGSRTISTQVSPKAKKRKINPASPIYVSMSPGYSPTTPPHQNQNNAADQSSKTKESPVYAPSSPVYYAPTSPRYSPTIPPHLATSPVYAPTSPSYQNQNNEAQSSTTKASPTYVATSPVYAPTSPTYGTTSPVYATTSPSYQNQNNEAQSSTTKVSPTYVATSPVYAPTSPTYGTTSPVYAPTSPPYQNQNNEAQSSTTKASPTYVATSPVYAPTSPTYGTTSPVYAPTSHPYQNQNNEAQSSTTKASPTYGAKSPVYVPASLLYTSVSTSCQNQNPYSTRMSSPVYIVPPSPPYQLNKPDPVQQSTQKLETDNAKNEEINQQILQYLKKHLPITAIDQLFRSYAETYKSFPPVIQAELMMEIAKLFSEKQMEVLRNNTNVNNNACTSMDLDSNR